MTDSPSENRATGGRKGVAWRLLQAVVLGGLVFLGGEAAVRLEDWVHWGTSPLSRISSQTDLAVRDAKGMHPAPGRQFRKWQINSLGTRGPEPDPARVGQRIVVLGASETFGLYESPGREYARQLADSLSSSRCLVDVLNAGYPGMSLPTVEQDVRLRLSELSPRVAIYYPTPAQYVDDDVPKATRTDSSGSPPPPASLKTASRFINRLIPAFQGMVPRGVQDRLRQRDIVRLRVGKADSWLFTTVPPDRIELFDADLRHMIGTLRARAITPILVTHANAFIGSPSAADDRLRAWERFYPRATGATIVAFDSVANERIRQVAADSGIALVDAWKEFHGLRADSLFADFSHFTDAGAARMAGLLRPVVANAMACGR